MAHVSTDHFSTAEARLLRHLPGPLALLAGRIRQRLIYRRTLAAVAGLTERNLHDIGAYDGAEAFARRAAKL